ncbi:Uncharacterised protein [Vibrio cholerae]|uniref:Uncharacterized protein n=1 Tax=Vibrio cholerae TaxID=666 RepID=A0A655ZYX4_VIBCL|nr:Uncharacterised protein [Vibrio cholerae]CRZ82666.1 Uncharacterised protein [Vibrio cholerae]CRZ85367.1 Uncharacterised protein [Vibrio cholerae]CSA01742.1 Uncharacterised protein [Vibrio cholerae]CSA10629.1 Uncharacterised protein [Vibrio cholerae]
MIVNGSNPLHEITDQETRNDGTDKPCTCVSTIKRAVIGNPATNQTGRERRAIGNGVGDVAGKDGNHQGKGHYAHFKDLVPHTARWNGHTRFSWLTTHRESQCN